MRVIVLAVHIVLALLLAPTTRADVIPVPGVPGRIQNAVDVAMPGDILLIAPGDYAERVVIDGKGLTLVADGGSVGLRQLIVRSLPPDQRVVLRGLVIDNGLAGFFTADHAGLILSGNEGPVRIEECSIKGASAATHVDGWPGTRVSGCSSVLLARSDSRGGGGASSEWEDGTSGGAALEIEDSRVVVLDSTLVGGGGGSVFGMVEYGTGGDGGHGVINGTRGDLHMANSVLVGWYGGDGSCDPLGLFTGWGGDGGHGLLQDSDTARVSTRDCRFEGGVNGGLHSACPCCSGGGSPGEELVIEAGEHVDYPAAYRAFAASSPVRELQDVELQFDLADGDLVLVMASLSPEHLELPGRHGVLLVGSPLLELTLTPPPGPSTASVTVPVLPRGLEGLDVYLQLLVHSPLDGLLLGPTSVTTLLDASL